MKNEKNDRRSKFTRMVVKQSLLRLMEHKPLNKITVAEVCEGAEIYRGTFYNHFYDVYDVYEDIKLDLMNEIEERLNQVKVYDLDMQFFKEIMLLIYRNRDMCRLLIDPKNNPNFLQEILVAIRERFLKTWVEAFHETSPRTLDYIFHFNINGSIAIIASWLQGDMRESLDDVAELVGETNRILVDACRKHSFKDL